MANNLQEIATFLVNDPQALAELINQEPSAFAQGILSKPTVLDEIAAAEPGALAEAVKSVLNEIAIPRRDDVHKVASTLVNDRQMLAELIGMESAAIVQAASKNSTVLREIAAMEPSAPLAALAKFTNDRLNLPQS